MSPVRSLSVLILFVAASITGAEELKTLSGKNITGTLKSIDANNIVVTTDSGPVETPLSQALLLELRPARAVPGDAKYYQVRLLDDSEIIAKSIAFSTRDVELTLLSGSTLKVPLGAVVSVLKDAQDGTIRKQFQTLIKKGKLRSDLILIFKDGELRPVDGTLGDVDPDGKAIAFKREGAEPIKARFDVLQGVVFLRTDVPADSPVCKVIDQDGNTLHAAKLDYEGATLTISTPTGAKLVLKNEMLARLDFNLGRLTYLSDLAPAKLSESAFFAGFPSVRRDTNQDGRPIVLLDKNFAKGLTLEGGSSVEYALGGKYVSLKAVIGADTRAAEGALGKTVVTIYGDGSKLESVTVVPSELKPIAVNVSNVGTLRIVVDGPNFTGLSAYVTLADARISQ
jgi:hypothetical protein